MSVPETMRAVQHRQIDHACEVRTVPVPTPKPYELLVKILGSSLCRSDLMNFDSDATGLGPEDKNQWTTIGHEAAGEVVGVGAECQGFQVGDQVGFLPAKNVCFDCEACQHHQMWCETYGGAVMHGHQVDGFFAEYTAVHWRNAIVLPKELPAVDAAPLFCAGVTAYHGIADLGLPAGSDVAIIGCGGLGHLGIQYAKAKGYTVYGMDISDSQLEEAKTCGADYIFNTKTDPDSVAKIKKLTSGGCHAVVNYTASKRSYDESPKVLRPYGILMVVGHPHEKLEFSTIEIALHKFRIYGASNNIPANLKECVDFSVKHNIKPHITFFNNLDDIHEMIRLLRSGQFTGRMVIRHDKKS